MLQSGLAAALLLLSANQAAGLTLLFSSPFSSAPVPTDPNEAAGTPADKQPGGSLLSPLFSGLFPLPLPLAQPEVKDAPANTPQPVPVPLPTPDTRSAPPPQRPGNTPPPPHSESDNKTKDESKQPKPRFNCMKLFSKPKTFITEQVTHAGHAIHDMHVPSLLDVLFPATAPSTPLAEAISAQHDSAPKQEPLQTQPSPPGLATFTHSQPDDSPGEGEAWPEPTGLSLHTTLLARADQPPNLSKRWTDAEDEHFEAAPITMLTNARKFPRAVRVATEFGPAGRQSESEPPRDQGLGKAVDASKSAGKGELRQRIRHDRRKGGYRTWSA